MTQKPLDIALTWEHPTLPSSDQSPRHLLSKTSRSDWQASKYSPSWTWMKLTTNWSYASKVITWQHSMARVVEWDIKDWIMVASQPRTSSIKPCMTPSTGWMGYFTSEMTSSFTAVPRRNMTHNCMHSWHVWWKMDWPSHSWSAQSVCQR